MTVQSTKTGARRSIVQAPTGPGSVIFQASNQLHGIRKAGNTAATYHVIRWNSPGMLKK